MSNVLISKPLIQDATYRKGLPPIYEGNPFIEALPNFGSTSQIKKSLTLKAEYDESFRKLSNEDRLLCLPVLKAWFVPLNREIDFFRRIIAEILMSYRRRFIADPDFYYKVMKQNDSDPPRVTQGCPGRYTGCVISIMGISGAGKTSSVESWMNALPRAIRHTSYKGLPLQMTQVPCVNISCPPNASPADLCISFYEYMDSILGTNFRTKYGKNSHKMGKLLSEVVNIASLHCVGLFIIDDLENMSTVKAGGNKKLRNFIYKLSVQLGALIILVSTYEALSFILDSLRAKRRASELGVFRWDRLSGQEWDTYFKALWSIQFTREKIKLTRKMSNVFLNNTLGIPALAWVLYKLVQERAINIGEREGGEKITTELVESVARDNDCYLADVLEVIRTGVQNKSLPIFDLTPEQFLPLEHVIKQSESTEE